MGYDFKKEQKELYVPSKKPGIITVPKMNFVAVRGTGNPNDEDGSYKKAIPLLYGIAYTIKMSYKGSYKIDGFFEYTVPQKRKNLITHQLNSSLMKRGCVCNVCILVLTMMSLPQSHSWITMP